MPKGSFHDRASPQVVACLAVVASISLFLNPTVDVRAAPGGQEAADFVVADGDDLAVLRSLFIAWSTLASDGRPKSSNAPERRLVFVAVDGAIDDDGALDEDAVSAVPGPFADAVRNARSRSERCFAQSFADADGGWIALGVLDRSGADPEDVFRCFTVALIVYSDGDVAEYDVGRWRSALASLFSKQGGLKD